LNSRKVQKVLDVGKVVTKGSNTLGFNVVNVEVRGKVIKDFAVSIGTFGKSLFPSTIVDEFLAGSEGDFKNLE